jgi:hypothetical protein
VILFEALAFAALAETNNAAAAARAISSRLIRTSIKKRWGTLLNGAGPVGINSFSPSTATVTQSNVATGLNLFTIQ